METHRDLDGHLLVDAVLVVEVNAVHAEPLEAALTRMPGPRGYRHYCRRRS